MIILDSQTVGIWFVVPGPGVDWMASVREVTPNEEYQITYRFRYHKDDKAFESADKKSWFKGTCEGTRAFVIAAIKSMAEQLRGPCEEPVYEMLNDGDVDEFFRKFRDAPFVYVRHGTKEQTEQVRKKMEHAQK